MTLLNALLVTTVLQSTPHPRLDAVLSALAKDEARRETSPCHMTERTELEQLDRKGAREGRLLRTYALEQTPEGLRRTMSSESVEGEVSRLLRQRAKQGPEKAQPGPFHASERAHYRYLLEAEEGAARGVLRFEPIEPHEKRSKGHAVVSLDPPLLLELDVEPSKYPVYLDALRMRASFRQTACGQMPVRVKAEGHGKFLMVRARFRTETVHSAHARTKPPAEQVEAK